MVAFMDSPSNSTVGIRGAQLIGDAGASTRSCPRLPAALVFALLALGVNWLFPRLGMPAL